MNDVSNPIVLDDEEAGGIFFIICISYLYLPK